MSFTQLDQTFRGLCVEGLHDFTWLEFISRCWFISLCSLVDECKRFGELLVIKPTRCTKFSNLFLESNSTCFGQFLCPSSVVLYCTHSNGLCHIGLLTACEQDQDGTVSSWSFSQAVSKPVWLIPLLCVQWKTPGEGQKNCPKHAEFYSKNKFENLVHLVGFIIRIYHDAPSPEHKKKTVSGNFLLPFSQYI